MLARVELRGALSDVYYVSLYGGMDVKFIWNRVARNEGTYFVFLWLSYWCFDSLQDSHLNHMDDILKSGVNSLSLLVRWYSHCTFVHFSWNHVWKDLEPFHERIQMLKCASLSARLARWFQRWKCVERELTFPWTAWLWWWQLF